ncbi:MAG: deoxyribodipyrimidine photo-lyase [Acidobacteriota bacterium]|nr:deoxyribodipyrimidine photo-lyase [Acidobacteriota bacterium]
MPSLDSILASYKDRVRVRRAGSPSTEARAVVYWMQRAQRAEDNAALDLAIEIANSLRLPVVVFFGIVPFPGANLRHYQFMTEGLADTAARLARRNVAFVVRRHPEADLAKFCEEAGAAVLVGDENPLREPERWRQVLGRKLRIPYYTVDADVVVPSRVLLKAQYAARIIRPRLSAQMAEYLVPCTNPVAEVSDAAGYRSLDPAADLLADLSPLDRTVGPVTSFVSGTTAALVRLKYFVEHGLTQYPDKQGDPSCDGSSRLSPYLHFGHISPVTVALAVRNSSAPEEAKQKYLDELITWRELAVNFVTFNPVYDAIECAEPWAHRTLADHASDPRPILYTRGRLEKAATHDDLWNAAQRQMLREGWMHNYMRMYWAKKILEWSPSPQQAYHNALYLNDKYLLDGRDPNGYAGVAWALAGKFDRPWFDRPIFGTIRYMSGAAAKKKFDANAYVRRMNGET